MPGGQTLPGLNTKAGVLQGGLDKNPNAINKRLPSLDSATLKRQGSKGTPGTPRTKELDENGKPIAKARSKRAAKPVEEATIYYRLVQKDENNDLD